MNSSERSRAFRERRKLAGLPPVRGKSGKSGKSGKKIGKTSFVAIDSEGMDYSKHDWDELRVAWQEAHPDEEFASCETGKELISQVSDACFDVADFARHRTFLWGAGNAAEQHWLNDGKRALSSVEILEWLCDLRERFGSHVTFVAFAFSYDATQALADLPFETMQELLRKKSTPEYTIWNGYAIRYLKGKYLTVARMKPGPVYIISASGRIALNKHPPTHIYDVFGFFQTSFLKAVEGMPGCVSSEDIKTVRRGKSGRSNFGSVPLEDIKHYTSAELRALVQVMGAIRDTLGGLELRLTRWNGAGSIASAAMTRFRVKDHYPHIEAKKHELSAEQEAAMTAFFGGRIELLQYGYHEGPLYIYDIASAYPHAQASLPSMRGGTWVRWYNHCVGGYDDEWVKDIAKWNCLSLIEVHWSLPQGSTCPIGPFPYRAGDGAIFFPHEGWGVYCIEEVMAARACMPHYIAVKECYQFVPASPEAPFSWIPDYYALRRDLNAAHAAGAPYDVTEKVLKLAMNSAYGKTAQRVGGRNGEPPPTANPYYAAAITARTRARLLTAAMTDPGAVVMMATDGIVATRPLCLKTTDSKELGGWEAGIPHDGGLFVQSGVYFYRCAGEWLAGKTRGIRPQGMEGLALQDEVLKAWTSGRKSVSYRYTQYITLGAAKRGARWRSVIGYWMEGTRRLDVDGCGAKREVLSKRGRKPHSGLIPTRPARVPESRDVRSMPSLPEWLDTTASDRLAAEAESAEVWESKFEP